MIDLAPEVLSGFAREIAALPHFGCWAKVVIQNPGVKEDEPDYNMVRLHVFRNREGRWHLTLDEADHSHDSWSKELHWSPMLCAYDDQGEPRALHEWFASSTDDLPALIEVIAHIVATEYWVADEENGP